MKRLISILSIAMMLVCCVLAVPTAVSAVPATAPAYSSGGGQNVLYANGTSIDIYPASGGQLEVRWTNDDGSSGLETVAADTTIFAGSSGQNVDPDRGGSGGWMTITLHGVTVGDLFLCGASDGSASYYKVDGSVNLILEEYQGQPSGITGTLRVDYNESASIGIYKGTIANVAGVSGHADQISVAFTRGSGMTKEQLDTMFNGVFEMIEELGVLYIAEGNGKFKDGSTVYDDSAYIGEPLVDPDNVFVQKALTTAPDPGYKFAGWYLDKGCTNAWGDLQMRKVTEADFNNAPLNDAGMAYITLYAKWVPVSHDTGESGTGGVLPALLIMTGAAAGLAGGMRMMRKGASVK